LEVLVAGSSSLVGSHFVEYYASKYRISAMGRKNIFPESNILSSFTTVSLENELELKKAIESSNAEMVINYTAETNVDGCEVERGNINGHAYSVNTKAVRWIAEACKKTKKKLYHFSTDFVFDGKNGPYGEDDEPSPLCDDISWYGYTKYLSELEISRVLPTSDFCIIRIGYPYRAKFDHKSDFARNIISLFSQGKLFPLFDDQIFSPTLIDDVSGALDFLIRRNASGVYHVGCSNPTTPFDFASELISVFFSPDQSKELRKGSIVEFIKKSGKAPRPIKGGLKTQKLQREGFPLNTYQECIMRIFDQINQSL
jgi:dTDP-4-dehydrorhamnose reductase